MAKRARKSLGSPKNWEPGDDDDAKRGKTHGKANPKIEATKTCSYS